MVDVAADYWLSMRDDYSPVPNVKPGFMRQMIPDSAPEEGEDWEEIMQDIEPCILSKSTHMTHPHFFGYFPLGTSTPAILADILSGSIGDTNPASTELELIVMDWLGKMMKLPEFFLNSHPGPGLGMIQSSASDCLLVSMLTAKGKALENFTTESEKALAMGRLVAYTSQQAHSCVENSAMLASVKNRKVPTNAFFLMEASEFEKAVKEDIEDGLNPIFLCVTLVTTSACSFDDLSEFGPICEKYGIWLHVDAAYAGAMFKCPEYRHFLNGIEYADSYNCSVNKMLAGNFDCCAFWVRDGNIVKRSFVVDPVYLKHVHEQDALDFRGTNEYTKKLLHLLHEDGRIYLVPTDLDEKFVLRLAIHPLSTTSKDIPFTWQVIQEMTEKVFPKKTNCDELVCRMKSREETTCERGKKLIA